MYWTYLNTILNNTIYSFKTISKESYSQQGGETACSDWSLLSLPGILNFCGASVDTWTSGESSTQLWNHHEQLFADLEARMHFHYLL